MTRVSDDQLSPDEAALVASLRALPDEGTEPDWAQLERQIRLAVGPRVPTRWWRRWMIPVGAFASLTAAAVIWLIAHRAPVVHVPPAAPIARSEPAPVVETTQPTAVYLDGEAIEVGDVDPAVLLDDSDEFADGLMPASDLRWVDSLDDHALDRVEAFLDRKPHGKG